jgi:hypothetical protein
MLKFNRVVPIALGMLLFASGAQAAKPEDVFKGRIFINDHAVWKLEYIAFFARPLNDNEITLKFWELGMGSPRFVAGDEQYTRERGTRIFSAAITLAKPEFDTNKRYRMTIESGRRLLAETTFWLRGKGPKYSGKVEFTDEEAQQK